MLLIASIVYHLNLSECKSISSSSHHHHHHNSNQQRYNKLSPSTSTTASSTSTTTTTTTTTTVNWAVFRFDKTTSDQISTRSSLPSLSSSSSSTSMFVRDLFIESNSTAAPTTKKYLQDLLESSNSNNDKYGSTSRVNTQDYFENDPSSGGGGGGDTDQSEWRRGECKLKPVEISLRIRNCGRVVLNTTACSGFCKSGEQLLPGTGLKRKYCSSCKPYKFTDISYKVKCTDGSYNTVKLRTVSACSCFKQLDILVPLSSSSNKFDNLR